MSIEIQAADVAQDGSVTIKVDGKSTKYVKESDLGAVKGALTSKDSEIAKLQGDLATVNSKYDTSHQDLLKERTAKEQFETGAKESETNKTRVGELETEVAGLKTSSGEVVTKLTGRLRNFLNIQYRVDTEKLKDKTLPELEQIESALILTGVQPAPADYDGKGGGGGAYNSDELKGKSPLQLATMGYEEKGKSK